jgi:hypothetical protein
VRFRNRKEDIARAVTPLRWHSQTTEKKLRWNATVKALAEVWTQGNSFIGNEVNHLACRT